MAAALSQLGATRPLTVATQRRCNLAQSATRPLAGLCRPATSLQPPRAPAAARRLRLPPPAASGSEAGEQQQPGGDGGGSLLGSVGLWALWIGLGAYTFLVAPNQTPLRDSYFIEKLIGFDSGDGVKLNVVLTQLFLVMGVWPLIYTALLVPSGKSANGVPAWPFLTASYALGAFGLLPFMALWQPPQEPPTVPSAKEDLEGWQNLMQKGMESPLIGVLCLAGGAACLGQAALAGGAQWSAYLKLLEESRFVHTMTLDFLCLTSLAPFWMANDAQLRRWDKADSLLPVLSVIPVLGPALYLCLRPRAQL